jgi:hypothetical protein
MNFLEEFDHAKEPRTERNENRRLVSSYRARPLKRREKNVGPRAESMITKLHRLRGSQRGDARTHLNIETVEYRAGARTK